MPDMVVPVQVSLLLEPSHPPSAKVLWLMLRLNGTAVTPARLGAMSGFSQATVRKGLAQLAAAGWYSSEAGAVAPGGTVASDKAVAVQVAVPAGLLSDGRVRPHGRLLYVLLQTLPTFRNQSGEFTYAGLSRHTGLSAITIRQAIRDLSEAAWLDAVQTHRKAAVQFTLRDLDGARRSQEVVDAAERINRSGHRNEAIMKEYLSLLIQSDEFVDNARPAYLVNPTTRERLELDRYYPPAVGFEYHGPQHFRTTSLYPGKQELAERQCGDLVKEALCARRGIQPVVITRRDLSLKGMQRKVGTLLPLRDLRGHEELIRYLEQLSK